MRVSLASQSETNPPEKSNRVSVLFNVCEPFNFCLPIIHSHSLNFRRSLQLQTKQWAPKMGQAVQQEENKIDYCKMCKQPDADDEVLTTLIVCEAEIPSYYNCIGDYGCGKWFHVQCVERTQVPEGEWLCKDCANLSWGVADEDDDPTYGNKGLEITEEFLADIKVQRPDCYEEPHRLEDIAERFPSDGVCASPNSKKQ